MQQFGTAEVSRLARIPVRSLRSMVRARYVSPAKGARGALRFSFHDLIVLRTARHLLSAGIAARRVGEALRTLRSQLPIKLPAGGLSVTAAGGRVVVQEAGKKRDALSGQLLLSFEVRRDGETVQIVDTTAGETNETAGDECEREFSAALELEETDLDAAVKAYGACIARHSHSGARANLGRLLHLQGRISEALNLYRGDQGDVNVLYNQAVALEDLGRTEEAISVYGRVIELDPDFSDAHHNLALLWQQAGDQRRAVRHWNAYRRLCAAE
ncbi:MAG: tetratricopeptide repeat protein [Steroidobacteraceae bacterium]